MDNCNYGTLPSTSVAAADKQCFCCKRLVRPGRVTEVDFQVLMNPDNFQRLETRLKDSNEGLYRFATAMGLEAKERTLLLEAIATETLELCGKCRDTFLIWTNAYRRRGAGHMAQLLEPTSRLILTTMEAAYGTERMREGGDMWRNQLKKLRTSLITQGGIMKMQMRYRHRMGMEIRPPIVSSKNARRFLKTGNGDRGPRKNMARRTDFSGPGGLLGLRKRYANAKAAPGIPSEGSGKPSIVKQYSCLQCPRSFENIDLLQSHTFIHKLGSR